MATIEQLNEGIRRAAAANDANAVRVLGTELRRMQAESAQASPAAQEFYREKPPGEITPIEFKGRAPEQVDLRVGDISAPPELAAELLKLKSPDAGFITESNVAAMQGTMKGATVRDVLNREIASGGISPSETLDPQQFPVLAPLLEQYKQEMEPSILGAMARGAVSQVGPVLGGLAGGAAGSILGGVGGIAGGLGGAVAGGQIQGAIEEKVRTPEEANAARAQAAFDEARARKSRAIGEFAPQLLTGRPSVSTIRSAMEGNTRAITEVAIGSILGAGIPLATGGGVERAVLGGIGGAALQPRDFVARGFQKPLRTERAAQTSAGNIVKEYVAQTGEAPEAVAEKIGRIPRELSSRGVTPLTSELSGNEGLISLGNALSNMNVGLRNVRSRSRAAVSKNIGDALRQSGATFDDTEQFFRQRNEQLFADAQAAYESFMKAGDQDALGILQTAFSEQKSLLDAASGKVASQEGLFDAAKEALEKARVKIASRTGQKDVSSNIVKEVFNDEKLKEKALVDDAYAPVNVSNLKSDAANTLKAAIKAKGPEGAGLFGNVPPLVSKVLSELKPKKAISIEATPEWLKGVSDESFQNLPESIRKVLSNPNLVDANDAKRVTVQDLRSGISAANGSIGASNDSNEIRILKILKEGFEKDIDALGEISSQVAAANSLYRAYKLKYGGAVGDAIEYGKLPDSRTLDAYMAKPTEFQQVLRSALKERPEAMQAVEDWIINDLANSVGENATPQRFNSWLNKRQVEGWLKVFPEVMPSVQAYASEVSKATEGLSAAQMAMRASKEQMKQVAVSPMAKEQAKIAKEAAKRRATLEIENTKKAISESAATRVLGQSAVNAIDEVMSKGNPARSAQELVKIAATDKTGKASEGLKNAMYEYMQKQFSRYGEVVSTLEDTSAKLTQDQLAASYAGLNKMLVKDSSSREAVEAILGKNSPELKMLDLYRGQIEVMERFRRPGQGQSVTSLNTELSKEFNDRVAKNTLGFLGRLAYMSLPEGMKSGATSSAMRGLIGMVRWNGDTADRARAIMVEAMTDPKLMKQLLTTINKENEPQARAFIKTYFTPNLSGLPEEKKSEK